MVQTKFGDPATKKAAREWLKRTRENTALTEKAIAAGDWEKVALYTADSLGALSALEEIAEALR